MTVYLAQLISGLAIGCIYGLIAIGFSMIYRSIGLVNFAQGDIMMLGAFIGFTVLTAIPGTPLLVLLVVAMLGMAVFGAVIERIAFRPAVARRASQIYLVLLTLGVGIVISNAARLIWGANPVVYATPLAHDTVAIGSYPVPTLYFYIFGFMIVLLIVLQYFFTRTWLGLAMRAAADDRETARLFGVRVGTVSSASFAIASAIGAAAGVLYAPVIYVAFDMGGLGLKAFAAAVIGSFGSVPGAVVGGLGLGVAESMGSQLVGSEFRDSIAFATMIAVLLWRPNGLLGRGIVK